ncbi:hypothetical protein [Thermoanaerobacterium thermosaccharolyticum]|uniref:Uncharacterized protein n=1 Tax=Thermoanaerobacterium thermosaccharolyticum M0795 TaxID=698948 RepID=L0IKA4_THETR|nr:hypothetical protein [Thermoanaerobacterium thermosaccharolyticum]AGB18387.1 hypothetical protein Thethe_00699 [Thermoanaerobacterium thermosaccharolyticum M0795]MCP2239630.1 formiminotetrahydrofolate cyclodeaminase [Thermoanaerobacterium thermosaccharolyticum]
MKKVSFEISDEQMEEIKELKEDLERDGFSSDDCYRAIFEMGIKAYWMERKNPDDKDIRKQFIMLASKYSAMRFKYFQLVRDNQTLDIKLKGYEAENNYLRGLSGIRTDEE